jgi:conserved oligomeric Golgi complex subunit 6
LKAQLEDAKRSADVIKSSASADQAAEIERLKRELSAKDDDYQALQEAFVATKGSISEMSNNHARELEEAARARAEESTKLRAAHNEEMTAYAKEKGDLFARVSDLEGEIATLKAAASAAASAAPKTNGAAPSAPAAGMSAEDVQRLHQAHTLKIHDLQSQFEKEIKALQEGREQLLNDIDKLNNDVARKAMEVQYLEADQDEHHEEVQRCVF